MAVERRVSPLPPGRYWVRAIGQIQRDDLGEWFREMAGAARAEVVEFDEDDGSEFVIFVVPEGRAPFFPAERFGFPEIAPPSVRTSSDVERVPTPPGPADRLRDFFDKLFGDASVLGLLLVLALASQSKKR